MHRLVPFGEAHVPTLFEVRPRSELLGGLAKGQGGKASRPGPTSAFSHCACCIPVSVLVIAQWRTIDFG